MTNPYALFKKLLPNAPLEVGDVIAFNDGTATIELPDGGLVQARGDVDIGDRVFVRNGVIEGDAPDLTVEFIEV
jgi:hypothetical protein